MQGLENFSKNIKSLNAKRKQLLTIQTKIKDEKIAYQKELTKLKNSHERKLTKLQNKQDEITDFLLAINEYISNSSPCGDELASDTLTKEGC